MLGENIQKGKVSLKKYFCFCLKDVWEDPNAIRGTPLVNYNNHITLGVQGFGFDSNTIFRKGSVTCRVFFYKQCISE